MKLALKKETVRILKVKSGLKVGSADAGTSTQCGTSGSTSGRPPTPATMGYE